MLLDLTGALLGVLLEAPSRLKISLVLAEQLIGHDVLLEALRALHINLLRVALEQLLRRVHINDAQEGLWCINTYTYLL